MATNSVESVLAGAKKTLADANKFTNSVTGNATDAFAPKEEPKHISGVPSYKQAHEARKAGGLADLAEQAGSEKAIEARAPLKELNKPQ